MADITFVEAQIGGGKTLFSTIQMCEELERSDRFIVTNVPLILSIISSPARALELCNVIEMYLAKMDKEAVELEKQRNMYWTIQEYCQTWIKRPVDVSRRLVCLTEEQTREFWRYIPCGDFTETPEGLQAFTNESDIRPSRGFILPNVPDKLYSTVPDFTFRQKNPRGVMYVLDEVHQHFAARFWQQTGPQAERYMSQLRKLNDDLFLISQHAEKVDKNFRRNATRWIEVENMSKSPLFMGVTFEKRFRARVFNSADRPMRFDKPDKVIWYNIGSKYRYEWLYRTTEGVGVNGGIVKEESMHRGRHWSVWAIAIAAICVGAYFFPRVVMSATQKIVMTTAGAFQTGVAKGVAASVPNNAAFRGPAPAPAVNSPPPPQPIIAQFHLPGATAPQVPTEPAPTVEVVPGDIYCRGYCPVGTNMHVFLSDGSTAKSEYGEVQGVGEKYVRVFGRKIPVK